LQTVHMTDLDDEDLDAIAPYRIGVAHCPESNQKLGSGICPAAELTRRGINIGLGTDGAASNNDLDLFQELRSAALLAKVSQLDPTALAAIEALEMATLGGARFLGLEQQLGSLEPGKQADMIAVDLSDIRHQPVYHPTSQLTYTATGQDVTHTWIAGELLYANRQHNRSDLAALRASIQDWQSTINRLT
jgi:5-methylthioadenosine/S-adenosylhomocysteine deaminase